MGDFDYQLFGMIKPKKFFNDSKTRKAKITKLNMDNMFRRTCRMFKWNGLPETIPQRYLELVLQINGVCGFIKEGDNLYCVWGNTGGVPNYNYLPTQFIVANPYLKLFKTYTVNLGDKDDCILCPNDSLFQGMVPLISYHSELLTEIQLTKRCVMITHRSPVMATAPTNNDKEAIDGFFKDLENGDLKSIYDKNFLKNIDAKQLNNSAHNIITQVLEMEQYQKASLFNDIGLQMNYNMKRETITSSEAQLGESALLPLCDDMLEMRKLACERVNKMFDVNWSVEFDSAWQDLRKSIEVEMAISEKELNETEQSDEIVQSTGQKKKFKLFKGKNGENNETDKKTE